MRSWGSGWRRRRRRGCEKGARYVCGIEAISSVLFSLIVPIKLGSWIVRQGDRRTLTR